MTMHGVPLPILEYHSDEWHEARRKSLGASEVAAALGFSSYQSTYSLWCEKTGRLDSSHREETAAMRWGKVLEPVILDEFRLETGLGLAASGWSWRHPDIEWATASPDGLAMESQAEDADYLGAVDAKTAFGPWHPKGDEPDGRHVPEDITLQMHWQFFVTGLDRGWVPLFAVGHRSLYVYEMERDEHLIDVVRSAAEQFWHYVTTDTEPPVDEHQATKRALTAIHEPDEGHAVELSAAARRALDELRQVKARMEPLKERREHLENVVKAELVRYSAEIGLIAGVEAVTFKTHDRAGYHVKPSKQARFLPKDIE